MDKYIVRKAKPYDAYSIAFVNAHTWYTAYKGLIPEKVLETRIATIDETAEKTREFIENGKEYLIAENTETNEIVGMLYYGASRNEDYPDSGEIVAIYVLQEYQGMGIGKKLFLAGIDELRKLGYNNMIINVLKGNNAVNFYKKYGGKIVGERSDKFGKIILQENIMFFDDLTSIK